MKYLCATAENIPAGCRLAVSGRDLSVLSATGQQEVFWTEEIRLSGTRLLSSDQFQGLLGKIALLRPELRDVKKPRGRVSRRREW